MFGIFVHTAGPNTALIKSSSGKKKVSVIIGGRLFAIPILQRVDRLSLALRTIIVKTSNGLTSNGVAVNITSVCQIKIQGWLSPDDESDTQPMPYGDHGPMRMDYSAIRVAAQHFLGKTDAEIEDTIQKTVSGHQRSIIGALTIEDLYRDRATFCKQVLELISTDMRNMGLSVVSYTVSEMNDANGYIDALGVTRTEETKRKAVEGQAVNRAAAKARSAKEEAAAHIEVNIQLERKILSDKHRAIDEAKAQKDILEQRAIQSKANDISSARQDAILLVERQRTIAAETEAELDVIKQQVARERLLKQKQVHVQSDAMFYKAKQNADAARIAAQSEADRIQMLGQAEADAVRARGLAEVKVLQEQIDAWQDAYVLSFSKFFSQCPCISIDVSRSVAFGLIPNISFFVLIFCLYNVGRVVVLYLKKWLRNCLTSREQFLSRLPRRVR